MKEQSATLEAELNSLRKEVVSERAEKERQGKKLKEMQERDEKDTLDLEDAIGFTIEGAGGKSTYLTSFRITCHQGWLSNRLTCRKCPADAHDAARPF